MVSFGVSLLRVSFSFIFIGSLFSPPPPLSLYLPFSSLLFSLPFLSRLFLSLCLQFLIDEPFVPISPLFLL